MRRCPKCGTVNGENENLCGICGADLWGAKSQSLGEAVNEEEASERARDGRMGDAQRVDAHVEAVLDALLDVGLTGLIIIGLVLLAFSTGWSSTLGLMLILTGIVILWAIAGKSPFRAYRV